MSVPKLVLSDGVAGAEDRRDTPSDADSHDVHSLLEHAAVALGRAQAEAKALRAALRDSEGQRHFIENVCQNLSRQLVTLHENFDERLTMLTMKHEARCQEIEKRLGEIGGTADRNAQFLTAYALEHPERDPFDGDSLGSEIDRARASE